MKKGDIVVVPFPFTDLSGVKLRPSVVLIESNPDIVVAFITSKTKLSEPTLMIKATVFNGLKTDSFLRLNKITTIDKDIVYGRLGSLTEKEVRAMDVQMLQILKITIR